jgi:hypothetical protein
MTNKLEVDAPPMSGHAVQTGYDVFYGLAKTSFDNALELREVSHELRIWFEGRGLAYCAAASFFGGYIDQSCKDAVDKLSETYQAAYHALAEESEQ